MAGTGRFIEEEVVLSSVEASDILVAHSAVGESEVHALRFENGEMLKVRTRILITMERMEFKEADDDDRAVLEIQSHGKVEFLNEGGTVLFDTQWQGKADETRVALHGDRVDSFEARLRYSGTGLGPCQGQTISGEIRCIMDGQDTSGLEVFKIFGAGEISK